MKRLILWALLGAALSLALAFIAACAGDDDDDDNDDFDLDDDQTGDDDDDDNDAPPGPCRDYANAFFGSTGCFPNEAVYESTLELCKRLFADDNPYQAGFFACLTEIDCTQYEDMVALWEAIDACLALLPD